MIGMSIIVGMALIIGYVGERNALRILMIYRIHRKINVYTT